MAKKTRNVQTNHLEVGMIVNYYGARFRLSDLVYTNEDGHHPNEETTLRAFATEFLGNVDDSRPHSIPTHWVKDWKIQGNHWAVWAVEI